MTTATLNSLNASWLMGFLLNVHQSYMDSYNIYEIVIFSVQSKIVAVQWLLQPVNLLLNEKHLSLNKSECRTR